MDGLRDLVQTGFEFGEDIRKSIELKTKAYDAQARPREDAYQAGLRRQEEDALRLQEANSFETKVRMSDFGDRLERALGLRANAFPQHMPPAQRALPEDIPWGM